VVNLSELAVRRCAKVNHQTTSKNCLKIDHLANHRAALAKSNLFSDGRLLGWIFQIVECYAFKTFGCSINVGLLLENNFENGVVHSFKNFDELSHVAVNFLGVVLGTVHLLQQIKIDSDLVAQATHNFNLILQDLFNAVIGNLRQVFTDVELLSMLY
jgi:hypothetical protein